jgi:hypothetical protein
MALFRGHFPKGQATAAAAKDFMENPLSAPKDKALRPI